ncbi:MULTISPECIES: DNA alkylation repair protein [unclassified Agromyces]|uniref:DNA alkylation repair protein n=1 Tax=unclassified Agromyces TaxID=2639701 RepID=UPI00301556ED
MAPPTDAASPTADDVRAALAEAADPERAAATARYFKTGPGEYGEGDRFIGVPTPQLRAVARRFAELPLAGIGALLRSPVHEHRAVALVLLVARFDRASARRTRDDGERARLARFYLDAVRAGRVDNWDLVDLSADRVLGEFVRDPGATEAASQAGLDPDLLDELAASPELWERRVAVMSTFAFLKHGDAAPTLRLAERLLDDAHDLIHKATGWMLREAGRRVGRSTLTGFLDRNAARMPRTMLSYATEHLDPAERARYRAMR